MIHIIILVILIGTDTLFMYGVDENSYFVKQNAYAILGIVLIGFIVALISTIVRKPKPHHHVLLMVFQSIGVVLTLFLIIIWYIFSGWTLF